MELALQKCASIFLLVCTTTIGLRLLVGVYNPPVNSYKTLTWSEEDYKGSHHVLRHATFRDLRPFLSSTETSVMGTQPPIYLADVKNPCFALTDGYINVGNISVMAALLMEFEVRCLPAAYIAGMTVSSLLLAVFQFPRSMIYTHSMYLASPPVSHLYLRFSGLKSRMVPQKEALLLF